MAEFTGEYDAGLAVLDNLRRVLIPEQWDTAAGPLERRLTALKALEDAGDAPTAETLFRVGETYGRGDGLDEERLSYLRRAVELDPANPELLWDIAFTTQATARYDAAIEWFQKALAAVEGAGRKPTARQLTLVGLAYVSARRYDDAVAFMLEASADYPNDTTLLLNIAGCYRMTKQIDKAIEVYEKVLAIDPANADAKRLLEATRAELPANTGDETPMPESSTE
jgi:tetratricopeptide (TPR) repeat protein